MPTIKKANWTVEYGWSPASGLRLGTCDYAGIRVIANASVPFIYVNYEGDTAGPFTDELRSNRSTVDVRRIMFGFDLKITYDFYGPDYQYEHVWRFHEDGQFGSTIIVHGPGEEIGGRHMYHLPFRYDLDISGESGDSFQRRLPAGGWEDVDFEGRHLPFNPGGREYHWRVIDKARDKSANIRARGADNAELWALRYKPLESWGSWGAVTAAVPGSPGSVPAIYDNGQTLQNTDIVVWYVAHVSSLERVAVCGPWFRLAGYPTPEPDDTPDHEHGHEHDHHLEVGDHPHEHHDRPNREARTGERDAPPRRRAPRRRA